MNKVIYILFILVFLIVIGFIAGALLSGGVISCTEMGCLCYEDGELPCNTCEAEDPVFALGVLNVMNVCKAKEVLICKDKDFVSRRFDIQEDCRVEVKWFDFVLNYIE